jgi:hypothetical protein
MRSGYIRCHYNCGRGRITTTTQGSGPILEDTFRINLTDYSTVTLLARLRGLSTSHPRSTAM